MHKLIDYACEELEQLEKKASKGNLSAAEIEYADKLARLKKNLLKGEKLYDEMEGDYSGAMMPMSYRGGNYSYTRGGQRRDSMGRYSRDSHEMAEKLYELMESAPDDSTRRDIERLIHKVEKM